jgi:hypothetical protein
MIKGGVGDYVKLQHKGKMKKEIIRIAAAVICAVVLICGSMAMNVKADPQAICINDLHIGDVVKAGVQLMYRDRNDNNEPSVCAVYYDGIEEAGGESGYTEGNITYYPAYLVKDNTKSSQGWWVEQIEEKRITWGGDSGPVAIVYLVSTDPSAAVSTSNTATASHVHNYEWVTVREATATEDGEMDYMCSCGDVKERQTISKYTGATKEVNDALDAAKSGQTITLDTGDNCSFNRDTMDKIANDTQNNIKVVIKYIYKGVHYIMTIPAGSNPAAIRGCVDSNGYAGFRQIDKVFPGTVVK